MGNDSKENKMLLKLGTFGLSLDVDMKRKNDVKLI